MFFTVEETNLMCCFDTSSRKRLIAEMKSLPIDELEKLATDFTEADFDLFAEDVLDLLDSVGVDTALLRRLMQLPSDLETFFRQTMEALTECARLRFEIFREAYEQSREAISERDYREYLDRIEREFGSLNAYWDSLSQ